MHQHTKILLKSVQMILRYHDFSIYQMTNGYHAEFI